MEKQKNCEELFEEYKRLQAVTHIEAQTVEPGSTYEAQHIRPQDLMRRDAVAKELVEHCEEYFKDKPAEWFEIQQDASIGGK